MHTTWRFVLEKMSQEITSKLKAKANRIGWLFIIFSPLICSLLGAGLTQSYYNNYVLVDFTKQKEEQYYRGVYDSCRKFGVSEDGCLKMADTISEDSWFESPSKGWYWPIRILKSGEQPG